jgi:hypothetical protein
MLGQLSFHSNLNERAFSKKLKTEFPEKEKGEGRNKMLKRAPGKPFSPAPEASPQPI